MSVDQKTLDRIGKLIKLAAPSGGSTEHERASAALEAVRLIDEFGVTLNPESSKDNGHKKKTVVHGAWVLSVALQHCSCSHCGNRISRADIVWLRVINHNVEYRHNCAPCKVG